MLVTNLKLLSWAQCPDSRRKWQRSKLVEVLGKWHKCSLQYKCTVTHFYYAWSLAALCSSWCTAPCWEVLQLKALKWAPPQVLPNIWGGMLSKSMHMDSNANAKVTSLVLPDADSVLICFLCFIDLIVLFPGQQMQPALPFVASVGWKTKRLWLQRAFMPAGKADPIVLLRKSVMRCWSWLQATNMHGGGVTFFEKEGGGVQGYMG